MKVSAIHNVIGWVYDKLRIENRKTFTYDNGSSVTVIERRTVTVMTYNKHGKVEHYNSNNSTVDFKS